MWDCLSPLEQQRLLQDHPDAHPPKPQARGKRKGVSLDSRLETPPEIDKIMRIVPGFDKTADKEQEAA